MTTAQSTLPMVGACDHASTACTHTDDAIRYTVRVAHWQDWLASHTDAKPSDRSIVRHIIAAYEGVVSESQRATTCPGTGESGLDVVVVPGSYRVTATCPSCGRKVPVNRTTGGLGRHQGRSR